MAASGYHSVRDFLRLGDLCYPYFERGLVSVGGSAGLYELPRDVAAIRDLAAQQPYACHMR